MMIDILKASDSLCRTFFKALIEENDAEVVMELLLEARDGGAQRHCARVIKYLLCKMKMLEKDDIINETMEKYNEAFTPDDGIERTVEKERPKALSLRFLSLMMFYLNDRAARNWR